MGLRSDLLRGTLLGLLILGIGGRLLMRVIAHMEGRVPAFTLPGSLTVVFAGTVAGVFSGVIYHLLRRFVSKPWVRTAIFIAICELVAWRGVHGLLPLPQVMFMTLALVYLVIVDALGRHSAKSPP
ncbi:MAG TPA: hypothetical protein VGO75_09025 [Gemmatimonadaceae bacterium]|jgi:hypothetical protein|nr:hypothetical protein [Gemmatimonadaceae bacterium]